MVFSKFNPTHSLFNPLFCREEFMSCPCLQPLPRLVLSGTDGLVFLSYLLPPIIFSFFRWVFFALYLSAPLVSLFTLLSPIYALFKPGAPLNRPFSNHLLPLTPLPAFLRPPPHPKLMKYAPLLQWLLLNNSQFMVSCLDPWTILRQLPPSLFSHHPCSRVKKVFSLVILPLTLSECYAPFSGTIPLLAWRLFPTRAPSSKDRKSNALNDLCQAFWCSFLFSPQAPSSFSHPKSGPSFCSVLRTYLILCSDSSVTTPRFFLILKCVLFRKPNKPLRFSLIS